MNHKINQPSVLLQVGIEPQKSPFMTPTGRVLQYHVISYITSGQGYFVDTNKVRTPVQPGTILYQFPNAWHCFDPLPKTQWKEYWIMFKGDIAIECFGPILPERPMAVQVGIMDEVIEAWEELYDILGFRQPGYTEYAQYLLHKILITFHRQRNRQVFFRMDDDINQLRHQMRAHLHEAQFDVEGSPQAKHMGYDQLRKRFKRSTGIAPKEYFLLLKVNKAKEFLLRPTLTIKEIAQRLGFADQYYFSRLFKHRAGVSPVHYRQQLLKSVQQELS
jgi:AraC-like DNA-binding protein